MKCYILLLALFFFSSNHLNSQSWTKYIEGKEDLSTQRFLIETGDGGFVFMVSSKDKYETDDNKLIKIDAEGKILWSVKFNRINSFAKGTSFYFGGQERIVIVYSQQTGRGKLDLTMKIFNSDGELWKSWVFADEKRMRVMDVFYEKEEICMRVRLSERDKKDEEVFIYTNRVGKEIDYKNLNFPKEIDSELSLDEVVCQSSKTYFAPLTEQNEQKIAQIKKGKKIIWDGKICEYEGKCHIKDIKKYKSVTYVVGSNGGDLFVSSLSKKGELLWSKKIKNTFYYYGSYVNADDEIIIGTGKPTKNPEDRGRLLKFNKDGKKVWERSYLKGKTDNLRAFCLTDDGGFLMLGYAQNEVDEKYKLILIRTDKNGIVEEDNIETHSFK
jgi:hypothetical protein